MSDFTDLILEQWKLACQQADGNSEGIVSILATTLAFATAEGNQNIDEVLSRVRDDFDTGFKAQADLLRQNQTKN